MSKLAVSLTLVAVPLCVLAASGTHWVDRDDAPVTADTPDDAVSATDEASPPATTAHVDGAVTSELTPPACGGFADRPICEMHMDAAQCVDCAPAAEGPAPSCVSCHSP
jgi:hypothetical protein